MEALSTTFDRQSSAFAAGDFSSAKLQTDALEGMYRELQRLEPELSVALANLKIQLAQANLLDLNFSSSDVELWKGQLLTGGFSTAVLSELEDILGIPVTEEMVRTAIGKIDPARYPAGSLSAVFDEVVGLTATSVLSATPVPEPASECLGKGQSPKTVQNTTRCLSSLLSNAIEDGLIQSNPAAKPGKFLPKISKRRAINPLTRDEVATLIAAARSQAHPQYVLLLCAVRSGLRQGELLALEWGDLNFAERFIEVRRSHAWENHDAQKWESRRVDMSLELAQAFKDLRTERQLQVVANDWKTVPQWVFCNRHGRMLHHNSVRRAFHALLNSAGVRCVRFHDLRHTFASLLLQQGESPVYVKEQMGHSSIQVTVDEYGPSHSGRE